MTWRISRTTSTTKDLLALTATPSSKNSALRTSLKVVNSCLKACAVSWTYRKSSLNSLKRSWSRKLLTWRKTGNATVSSWKINSVLLKSLRLKCLLASNLHVNRFLNSRATKSNLSVNLLTVLLSRKRISVDNSNKPRLRCLLTKRATKMSPVNSKLKSQNSTSKEPWPTKRLASLKNKLTSKSLETKI